MKTKSSYAHVSLPLRWAAGAVLVASTMFAQPKPSAPAQPNPPAQGVPNPIVPPKPKDSGVTLADRSFVAKAAKAAEEEVTISTVAINRSTNQPIKEYAQMLVNDHQKMRQELSALATNKGIEFPIKGMSESKWGDKNAENFDRDYLKAMIEQHEDVVELFSKAAKSDDAQIASFAGQQLPKLQSHLSKAKDLLNSIK